MQPEIQRREKAMDVRLPLGQLSAALANVIQDLMWIHMRCGTVGRIFQ